MMTFTMSDHAQTIRVYNLRADTREFIGEGDAWIPPWTGLPADCTDIAPPDIPEGHVAIFDADSQSWALVEDHRGQTVYSTENRQAMFISTPGPLPENTTCLVPEAAWMVWDGEKWVEDPEALAQAMQARAEAERQRRLDAANRITADWRVELMLGTLSGEDKTSLAAWMAFIKALKALDFTGVTDEASFEAIDWPAQP